VANKTSNNGDFKFLPPQALLWTPTTTADPGYPLFGLDFSADTLPPARSLRVLQQVYLSWLR
jgi:hypothetical protein